MIVVILMWRNHTEELKTRRLMEERLQLEISRLSSTKETPIDYPVLSEGLEDTAKLKRRSLTEEWKALLGQYDNLSDRITALYKDIGYETDSERNLNLRHRLLDVSKEREGVLKQIEEIERQLSSPLAKSSRR